MCIRDRVYAQVLDRVSQEKKNSLTGQMSLFELMPEDNRDAFDLSLIHISIPTGS